MYNAYFKFKELYLYHPNDVSVKEMVSLIDALRKKFKDFVPSEYPEIYSNGTNF